jgi:diguanylate cyclase (GGDEF)-like protein/PAS domain S-box-containing protein
VPTVPGYLLAIVAVLTLADRGRLRARGLRLRLELALFVTASVVVVHVLVVGPEERWSALGIDERLVLGAAVLATSATMAAALTLLGVVEPSRQRMALVLLGGTVLLTGGRGLGTSALISGAPLAVDASRFLVAGGLWLLAAAVLTDPETGAATDDTPGVRGTAELGQLLPHLAMVAAVTVTGAVAVTGSRPGVVCVVGLVLSVALAAAHRWVSARDEARMAARLLRSEAYFRSLVRSSGDAVVILDDALRVTGASPALERVLGAAAAELVGRPLVDAVHPDDVAAVGAALSATGSPAGPEPAPGSGLLLLRLADGDGVWRYLEASVSDLRDHADVGAVVLHCRDMTDRHAREQALQNVAYTDAMTGLPNRAGLLETLRAAVSTPRDEPGTLLMIELDGLAEARDDVGREIVRLAVTEIARRLRGTVRGEDVVARMGGGAFAVLASGNAEDADRLADRCLAVVERPIPTPAGIIELTAGIGLVAIEDGLGVDTLLSRGDLAVRSAHAAGRGSAARFTSALGEAAARRDRLREDLHGARVRDELFLLVEPILSLQDQRITGMEATLRWRHPDLGEIPPAEFLLIAERAGLLGELLRWTLAEATAAVVRLPSTPVALRVGLRLPAGYVATGTLVPDVQHALAGSGLAPERLVLQIDATAMASEDERVALDVAALRFMGVHVALAGFGVGASALAHLTRLPIDIMKLDRALIGRVDRDVQARALCESVVGIGRALALDVVAVGVETSAQLTVLRDLGVAYAQGYLISRPVPLGELSALLADGAGVPRALVAGQA